MSGVDDLKILAKIAVARSMAYKWVYKYLTYENGLKMLLNNNLQFTRGDKLNDPDDCNISKINFDNITKKADSIGIDSVELIDKIIAKHKDSIRSFGICSLGTTADNKVLWDRYTKTEGISDGVCIELDFDAVIKCFFKKRLKVAALKVDYEDNVLESIPYQLYLGTEAERFKYIQLLFATKNKERWEKEEEVRMFLPEELNEEYQRYELFKSCFKGIYLGEDVTVKQRSEIQKIIDCNKLKIDLQSTI